MKWYSYSRPLCDPLGFLAPQISTWVTGLSDSGGNRTKLKLAWGCIELLQKVLSISRMRYIESEKYAAACRAHLATYRIHSAVKNVIPKIQVPRSFLKRGKHQSSSAVGSSMTPAAKCVLFRRPLSKICIWSHAIDLGIDFSPLRTKN